VLVGLGAPGVDPTSGTVVDLIETFF